jgi:hypothetical protein
MTGRQFTTGCLALALWTTWALTRVTAGLPWCGRRKCPKKLAP